MSQRILCVGPTPAAQRVMVFRRLVLDQVNRATTTEDGAAGKSINVAKVLKILGQNPITIGFLGGPRGAAIRELLRIKGIKMNFTEVPAPTRECITVIDEFAGTQTELVEESKPVRASCYDALLHTITQHVKGSRAVVMSGTLTPDAAADFYFRCTALAREAGALAVVDAHGPSLSMALRAAPDVVKPNRAELVQMVGRELTNEKELISAVRELHSSGARQVVITAGKDPVLACDGKTFWRVVAPTIEAVNPTGSGDAFTAGLTWRLLQGDPLQEACRWAAACGAANALTLMPGELDLDAVQELAQRVQVVQL